MKYEVLLFKQLEKLETKKEQIEYIKNNLNNENFKELLRIYFVPFYKTKKHIFYPSVQGRLLQKPQHELFKIRFFELIKYDKVKDMTEFLNTCDIHAQEVYTKILNNTLKIKLKLKDVKDILDLPYYPDIEFTKDNLENVRYEYHNYTNLVIFTKHNMNIWLNLRSIYYKRYKWLNNREIEKVIKKIPVNFQLVGFSSGEKVSISMVRYKYEEDNFEATLNGFRFYYQFKDLLRKFFELPVENSSELSVDKPLKLVKNEKFLKI
jgi:hypothetical protein